jgi:hypothetical protein
MTGTQLQSLLETGTHALLLTLALVAAYVILRRMANQMRKGVDLATKPSIESVEMNWDGQGPLLLRITSSQGIPGGLSIVFECDGGLQPKPGPELSIEATVTEVELQVPDGAKAVAITTASEKIIRPLQARS